MRKLCVFLVVLLAAETRSQMQRYRTEGPSTNSRFGSSADGVSDLNGDGFAEIVVGSPGEDVGTTTDAGGIRVLSGDPRTTAREIGRFFGAAPFLRLGFSVAGIGDVNADGIRDILVGAPGDPNNSSASGSVYVLSGKLPSSGPLSVIKVLRGASNKDLYGHSVSGAGDVNRDGIEDILVGAPGDNAGAGSAYLISGADFSVIQSFAGQTNSELGFSVSDAGDVNDDGCPDFILGAPSDDYGGNSKAGTATVYSGADLRVLHHDGGGSPFDAFGYCVGGAGDLDQDGHDDVLVSSPKAVDGKGRKGRAWAISGRTWQSIAQPLGDHPGDEFGYCVEGVGDMNGDGVPDWAVGAPQTGSGPGYARVFSGKTTWRWDPTRPQDPPQRELVELFTKNVGATNDQMGFSIGAAGDTNNNGLKDVVVGIPGKGGSAGGVRVLSCAMISDKSEIHLGTTGTQTLSIDATDRLAGAKYIVFGSASGTTPKVWLGGVDIPLQPDVYTQLAYLVRGDKNYFENTSGVLDSSGKGTAKIHVRPPYQHGAQLWYSVLVYETIGGTDFYRLASNPVPLTVTNLQVGTTVPGHGTTDVDRDKPIEVPFNMALDDSTVNTQSVGVEVAGVPVPVKISYVAATNTIEIRPESAWHVLAKHTVTITQDVRTAVPKLTRGTPLAAPKVFSFTTKDGTWQKAPSRGVFPTAAASTGKTWDSVVHATSPTGRTLIAWRNKDSAGKSHIELQRYEPSQSANSTLGWQTRPHTLASETTTLPAVSEPHIAMDQTGRGYAIWIAGSAVYASYYVPGTQWTNTPPLRTGVTASAPRITMDESGHAFAVWIETSGSSKSLVGAEYDPGRGNTWQTAGSLGSLVSPGPTEITITPCRKRRVVVIQDGGTLKSFQKLPSGTWTATASLNGFGKTATLGNVQALDDDRVALAWEEDKKALVRFMDTTGGWVIANKVDLGQVLSETRSVGYPPRLSLSTDGGTLHVAWSFDWGSGQLEGRKEGEGDPSKPWDKVFKEKRSAKLDPNCGNGTRVDKLRLEGEGTGRSMSNWLQQGGCNYCVHSARVLSGVEKSLGELSTDHQNIPVDSTHFESSTSGIGESLVSWTETGTAVDFMVRIFR